jgi:hypothetical protein
MRWFIKQTDSQIYWKQRPGEELGVSGEWVKARRFATRFPDNERLTYIAEKGELPHGFEWHPVIERHKDAIEIQNAVNPAGIALALHNAYCEVIAEGGDTAAQKADPACKLVLFQLMTLSGYGAAVPLTDYYLAHDACAAKAEEQK